MKIENSKETGAMNKRNSTTHKRPVFYEWTENRFAAPWTKMPQIMKHSSAQHTNTHTLSCSIIFLHTFSLYSVLQHSMLCVSKREKNRGRSITKGWENTQTTSKHLKCHRELNEREKNRGGNQSRKLRKGIHHRGAKCVCNNANCAEIIKTGTGEYGHQEYHSHVSVPKVASVATIGFGNIIIISIYTVPI